MKLVTVGALRERERERSSLKNEKGSITLFVLIAMIFFVAIAMTAYVSASSKLQGQNAELERIKASYEQDISEEGLANLYEQLTTAKPETKTKPTAEDYGDYIEYGTVGTGLDLNGDGNVTNDWRIFYSNNDGVFIIAADYVPYSNTILQTAMNSSHANMANYTAYSGTEGFPYSAYWPTASYLTHTTIDSKSSIFLNEWTTVNYDNAKAVAALLDTNSWSGFLTDTASLAGGLAIGGPTLELYRASWNAKTYDTGIHTKLQITKRADDTPCGYYVTANNDDTSVATATSIDISSDAGHEDTLYYPHTELYNNCRFYWLTSPSAASSGGNIMLVSYPGTVSNTFRNANTTEVGIGGGGVRPVVYLPSSIQLKENSNGIWQIVKETKPELASTNETKPWLPTGCEITNNDLSTGVTIKDSNDNEWTWVVVPKTVTASATTNSAIETALRTYCTNNGVSNTKKPSGDNYDYTFEDTWYDGCGLSETQYNSKKSAMLNSIKNNGGFWIGKYEVGYTGTPTRDTNNGMTQNVANNPTEQTPVIKQNAYPYNYITCSQAEGIAETLASSVATENHTGSLMFGLQWDLTLVYLKLNTNPQIDPNNSTTWGNHKNSSFTITNANAKGTTTPTTGGWDTITSKAQNTATLLTTGAEESVTNKLNIVDLAGNVYEWTLENSSYTDYPCVRRGGYYYSNGTSSDYPASYRGVNSTTASNYSPGLRPTLY